MERRTTRSRATSRRTVAAIALVAALGGAACGGGDDAGGGAVVGGTGGTTDLPELGITAREAAASGAAGAATYAFDMPDRVEAGPARLTLANEGDEEHHAQLFRLDDGATVDDLAAALATGDPAAALAVGTYAGGTGLVGPGAESQADAVVDLEAGGYALLCLVPGSGGTPHLAHGMLQPFEVVEGDDPPPVPEADVAVDLVDFAYALPSTVPAHGLLAVSNSGTEMHEMVVARLDEGATADDVADALHHRDTPPATPVGGIQAIPPGTTQRLQLDLDRGRYVVMCHVPSPDGTPHVAKGMIAEVRAT
jgi:hypothetical protein